MTQVPKDYVEAHFNAVKLANQAYDVALEGNKFDAYRWMYRLAMEQQGFPSGDLFLEDELPETVGHGVERAEQGAYILAHGGKPQDDEDRLALIAALARRLPNDIDEALTTLMKIGDLAEGM